MRMFNGRVVRSSANFNGGKPTYFALVQWENGVDCSRATVNGGTFDRIAVGKRGKATKLTMHIRGGSENGYGGTPIRVDGKTVDLYCAIQTEHYARLIPLDANPGARLVDGACNCALPVMPRAEATKLLSELRVA
ncbi:MAG: hypothetical protein JWM86_584 [Thermoleophilia bacterium]|nr:hypothetical protein [Thermoleophilia bacterium]